MLMQHQRNMEEQHYRQHLMEAILLSSSGCSSRRQMLNAAPAKSHGRTALQAAASGDHLAVVDRLH